MALSIVTKLRDLAKDEENRPYIVKEQQCLPVLLSFIEANDQELISTSLETLFYLSSSPSNKLPMINEKGLLPKLEAMSTTTTDVQQQKYITAILTNIKSAVVPAKSNKLGVLGNVTCDRTNSATNIAKSNTKNTTTTTTTITKANPDTYTLYVTELESEEDRNKLEAALIKVKGVISFLIDVCAQKVVVRTLTTVEVIINAIANFSGFTASPNLPAFSDSENEDDYEDGYISDDDPSEHDNKGGIITKDQAADCNNDNNEEGGWFSRIKYALWG